MERTYRFSLKKGVENMPQKRQKLSVIVGGNIMARRKLRGWTQAEFAEQMGMGADSLSRIERGTVAPRFPRIEEMARLLVARQNFFEARRSFSKNSREKKFPKTFRSIPRKKSSTLLKKLFS